MPSSPPEAYLIRIGENFTRSSGRERNARGDAAGG
jgi:hypothetical protein